MNPTERDPVHNSWVRDRFRSGRAIWPVWLAVVVSCFACSTADPQRRASAVAPRCEIKVVLHGEQIDAALARLGLQDGNAERRSLWFFDLRDLSLFDHGVILRARRSADGRADSTVKLRPVQASSIAPAYLALPGFKLEEDRGTARSATACSLSSEPDMGELDAVTKGTVAIETLFDTEQRRFLHDHAPITIDWHALRALGAIDARVWDFHVSTFGEKLTAELWTLPDDTRFFEISIKVPAQHADETQVKLLEYLASQDLAVATDQHTKTRMALEYFAMR